MPCRQWRVWHGIDATPQNHCVCMHGHYYVPFLNWSLQILYCFMMSKIVPSEVKIAAFPEGNIFYGGPNSKSILYMCQLYTWLFYLFIECNAKYLVYWVTKNAPSFSEIHYKYTLSRKLSSIILLTGIRVSRFSPALGSRPPPAFSKLRPTSTILPTYKTSKPWHDHAAHMEANHGLHGSYSLVPIKVSPHGCIVPCISVGV